MYCDWIVFRFHAYITKEHTLTFEITFTWRTEIIYRMLWTLLFLHTCLMYWLLFKTDHDRLLTTLAKSIVSKETLCDNWLTSNLRGKKKNAALIFTASQPQWEGLFSQPATLNRIKIPRRTINESFFLIRKFWIAFNYQPARHYTG